MNLPVPRQGKRRRELNRVGSGEIVALDPSRGENRRVGGTPRDGNRFRNFLRARCRIPCERRILPSHGPAKRREHRFVRPRLAASRDHRLHAADQVVSVTSADVVVLEESRCGQQDIGKLRAVGHHLLGDHGE